MQFIERYTHAIVRRLVSKEDMARHAITKRIMSKRNQDTIRTCKITRHMPSSLPLHNVKELKLCCQSSGITI